MNERFVPPPNWPSTPPGWRPPAGWRPDPRWGPAPRGWRFWQEPLPRRSWFSRHKTATAALVTPLVLAIGSMGVAVGTVGSGSPETIAQPMPGVSSTAPVPAGRPSASRTSPAPTTQSPAGAGADARKAAEKAAAARRAAVAAAAQKAAAAKVAKQKAAAAKVAKQKAAAAKAAKKRAAAVKVAKQKAVAAKAAKNRAAARRAAAEKAAARRAAGSCTPGYSPCLPPASDYDCSGGSGNGPSYAEGPVEVTGDDPYDLDRDGDGIGCDD